MTATVKLCECGCGDPTNRVMPFTKSGDATNMSLPDHLLDEPDSPFCQDHLRIIPCWECQVEHAEDEADRKREERGTPS